MKLSEISNSSNRVKLSQLGGQPATIKPIGNFEKILENSTKGLVSGTMAGGPSLGMMASVSNTPNVEEGLPSGLQFAGNVLGGEIGLLNAGAPVRGGAIGGTIGRSVGEAGKQAIQGVLGKKSPDLKELGIQSGIGALSEVASMPFAGITNKFFGKFAGKEFRGKTGEVVGSIKDFIKKSPKAELPVDSIVSKYRNIADALSKKVQIHPDLSKIIYNASDDLERVGAEKGGFINAEDLMRSESFLSNELKKLGVFGENLKKGDFSDVADLFSAKNVASEGVSEMANKVGVGKELSTAKKSFAKVASAYPRESSKHGILKNILEAGGIHSIIRGDVAGSLGNLLASEAVGSNPLFNGIYQTLKVGKAVPTGISSLTNKLREYQSK